MKFIAFLLFIVCLFYLCGCTMCSTKQVDCAAFNETAFGKWFPYNDSSRIFFKNTITADTFGYLIAYTKTSEADKTNRGGGYGNANLPCGTSAYITSNNYDNSPFGVIQINYLTRQEVDNGPSTKNLGVHFNNADWAGGEIFENSFAVSFNSGSVPPAKIDSAQNFLFDNGITYSQVVILISDTSFNKTDRAYKLFIAKNVGIIGCEMFPSKQKWVMQ
jgi:hypothetical protein